MKAGIFLNSTPLLDDSFFEETVIFIAECNEKGAMGFVVNKLFPRRLNELTDFSGSIPFPLYDGGPVDREHLFFVHQRPDLISGGVQIIGNIFLGGNFKEAVKHIDNNVLTEKDVKLFLGYCGWDAHELEEEIAEGSWEVLKDGGLFY